MVNPKPKLQPKRKRSIPVLAALLVVLSAALFAFGAASADEPGQAMQNAPTRQSGAPLTLVSLTERELDGLPALALTFSEPLDPTLAYDKFIQVLKTPVKAAPVARSEDDEDDDDDDDDDDEDGDSDDDDDEAMIRELKAEEKAEGEAHAGKWVMGDNPRILFFPYISPQTAYSVIVAADLPDARQQTLGTQRRFAVRAQAMSPAYYFASRGMVLPAGQNGGLPVVTVNVPEVDVQFLRVRDEMLPKFLDRVIAAPSNAPEKMRRNEDQLQGAVDYWRLDNLRELTESVYAARFVTEQKPNRRSVTFLPVEELKELARPGVYVALMTRPGRFSSEQQTTYFYVSDLGLHARLFEKTADIYVTSLTSGRALPGVELRWLDARGVELGKAVSDSDGRAHFPTRPDKAKVIQARQGGQVAMIALKEPALDLSEYSVKGLPGKPVRLFAWSGRDLYRPGERFDVSVLVRDADGRSLPQGAALPIQAILKRPDGKKQFTTTWKPASAKAADSAEGESGAAPTGSPTGYYRETLALPLDAPTGFWTLELRADPADDVPATSFRFGVEEFLPERMKLALDAPETGLDAGGKLTIQAAGRYLYGAPASGNRLQGVARFRRCENPLPQALPGFVFGDVADDSLSRRVELSDQETDAAGKAQLEVDLEPAKGRHSPITVQTTVSLLESGGRPVTRSLERVIWPAKTLVGVRPLFTGAYARKNAPAQFEVVKVNQAGELLAAPALAVRLFREERRYYWRYDDNRGWNSGFIDDEELVLSDVTSAPAAGRGSLTVQPRWGRYRLEITDPENGETLKYRFYAGWDAKSGEDQGLRPDKVALKLDKSGYREGQDTVHLTITPPHAGEALITVEADRALWVRRLPVAESGATVEIPVDAAWKSHDLYVNVTVFRPGSAGDRVTPARALGIAPLPLFREDRKMAVGLEAPDKMRPEQDLTVQVSVPEAAGKQAMLTLSAVDAGILNITNFATPDPFGFFFGQLRYGADLHDIYGRLIEKMAGQKGRLRFGGDAAPKNTQGLPKKVKLVDLFSGPVLLDGEGKATVKLPVPDFNGTLKLMAVAATADSYGSAESEVVVAAPLVAELSAPRFMNVGDEAFVALDLHNLSGGPANLTLTVPSAPGLAVTGGAAAGERRITLAEGERRVERFNVRADRNFLGLAELKVQARGETGVGPLALERRFALEIMPITPERRQRQLIVVPPGESRALDRVDLTGFMPSTILAHLNVSDTPPLDVRNAVQGLLTYPYGCVEQTTSTAYPHLFIDEAEARRWGLKPFSLAQRAKMLDAAIAKLAASQQAGGGFNLWGGGGKGEYWLAAYVGNFLQDAEERGFAVPEAMRKKLMDYLLRHLQEGLGGVSGKPWNPGAKSNSPWQDPYAGEGRFNVLAYGAYVLARDGRAPLSTLRRLFELRQSARSGLSLVHLGLALHLMGDAEKSVQAMSEGVQKQRIAGWWGDYGSELRDLAMSYALLTRHGQNVAGQENLLVLAGQAMGGQTYFSTQVRMAVFLAGSGALLPKEAKAARASRAPWTLELVSAGQTTTLSAPDAMSHPLEARDLTSAGTLKNTSDRPLYAELALSARPRNLPAAQENGISLSRRVFTADGKPFTGGRMPSGESYFIQLHVESAAPIANLMVVDQIPAGLEIENLNLVQGEGLRDIEIDDKNVAETMSGSRILHQEFREDRYVAAVSLTDTVWNSKTRTSVYAQDLFYRVRAVTPGRYVWPSVSAEDMYRPAVNAFAPGGGRLTVSEGKEAAAPKPADQKTKP